MRKALVAALVATALAQVGPAHAVPDAWGVSCGLVAVHEPTLQITPPDWFAGVLTAAVVGFDDMDLLGGNPANVSVDCFVKVNGVTKDTASADFPVVAVPLKVPVMFLATVADTLTVCTKFTVSAGNGTHSPAESCKAATDVLLPPTEVCNLVPIICSIEFGGEPVLPLRAFVVVPDVLFAA